MPKTKKQSKTNKALSWLNPSSPAKSALLFVIVFAAIGGGYMAYKSFALEGKHITNGPDNIYNISRGSRGTDPYGSKGSVPGWLLTGGGQVGSNFVLPTLSTTDTYVRACASVRRAEASENVTGPVKIEINSAPFNSSTTTIVAHTGYYQRVCTGYGRFAPGNIYNVKVIVSNQSSTYWMYVSSIALEW